MKLFYALASPFARKTRIVARELELIDGIEEITALPYLDDPALLAVSPTGLVPTMILDDGTTLIDSPLICQYMYGLSKTSMLVGTSDTDRTQVLQHEALADAIMDFSLSVVVEQRRADGQPSAVFIERKLNKIDRAIANLPAAPTMDATAMTIGEIATACALGYLDFRLADMNWRASRPDLATWYAIIETRNALADTCPTDQPA